MTTALKGLPWWPAARPQPADVAPQQGQADGKHPDRCDGSGVWGGLGPLEAAQPEGREMGPHSLTRRQRRKEGPVPPQATLLTFLSFRFSLISGGRASSTYSRVVLVIK